MQVLVKEPGEQPITKEIAKGLDGLQGAVKGYIERVPLEAWDDNFQDTHVDCYVNEEGKIQQLDWNFPLTHPDTGAIHDMVCGPAIFCSSNAEGESTPISKEQVKLVCECFGWNIPDWL